MLGMWVRRAALHAKSSKRALIRKVDDGSWTVFERAIDDMLLGTAA